MSLPPSATSRIFRKKKSASMLKTDLNPSTGISPARRRSSPSLKSAAGTAEDIYLAPDPDREGEAIAWHTSEILKKKGTKVSPGSLSRADQDRHSGRHEVPGSSSIKANMTPSRPRRILDRLVGYQVSPLLWRKVKGGLSAGRVQSVTVRIICERERAIQAFVPVEYWSITAHPRKRRPAPLYGQAGPKKTGRSSISRNEDSRHRRPGRT